MTDVDVLIVGAGTAGIPCALEALAAGARVLLVDKADRVGGTLHLSGGHMSAAGTRRQRERGVVDDPADHLVDVERISRGAGRRDLIGLAVREAPGTVDWLDALGFPFDPVTPRIVYGHEPYGVPRTYYGPQEGRSILAVLEPLLAPHLATGQLQLWLSSPVLALTTDPSRVVTGADVRRSDGHTERVRAAATVLATGGYGADAALFAELDRAPLVTAASPTSTGDGLRLARELGAGLAGQGCFLPTFGGLPDPEDPGRARWHDRPLLVATERPPWEVYVDRDGARFVREDSPSIDHKERALARLPDLTFWTVFDARALRESRPMVVGWEPEDLDARAGVRVGVHRADSLEGLARAAGIDPAGLAGTVRDYNYGVAAGRDYLGRSHLPAPIAEPPFYALENHGVTLITFVGVDVDEQLRVRSADGEVVAGLWAAGEVLGAAATSGNSFCGGMLVTPALAFGRFLGRRLGAEVRLTQERSAPSFS